MPRSDQRKDLNRVYGITEGNVQEILDKACKKASSTVRRSFQYAGFTYSKDGTEYDMP
jgi:hypothetical protein